MIATSSWVEMLPNVLGRSVEVASAPNVTAAGAYVTATSALDGHESLLDSAEYDDHYQRWTEMAKHLEAARV